MSIRQLILSMIMFLGLIILSLNIYHLSGAFKNYTSVKAALSYIPTVKDSFHIQENLNYQRFDFYTAVLDLKTASSDTITRLQNEAAQLGVDKKKLIEHYQSLSIDKNGFLERFISKIEEYEGLVDRALITIKEPAMVRDKTVLANWLDTSIETAYALEDIQGLILNKFAQVDPELSMWSTALLALDKFSVLLSLEAAILEKDILQGKSFGPKDIESLSLYKGKYLEDLETLKNAVKSMNSNIATNFSGFVKPFEEEYLTARDASFKAGAAGAPYPYSGKDFKALVENQLTKMNALEETFLEELEKHANSLGNQALVTIITNILIAVASILASLFAYYAAIKFIIKPLYVTAHSMKDIADGNLDVEIREFNEKSELTRMVDALKYFLEKTREAQRLENETHAMNEEKLKRAEILEKMTDGFDTSMTTFLKELESASGNLQKTSNVISDLAQTGNQQADTLNGSSQDATSNINIVAAAAEELSASINEIAQQITNSSKISQAAVTSSQKSAQSITQLQQSAEKINDIVSLIDDIAEQTNLLALNATIEAARAGEAGKGFAVVANEVKTLASQTSKATAEISSQILEVRDSVNDNVGIIQEVQNTIGQMEEISTAISAAIEEQMASVQEIVRSAQNASQGAQLANDAAGSVAQSSNDTLSAAGDVDEAAKNMVDKTVELREELEVFLSNIKTQ